jgi:hypothetical protein
MRGEQVKIQHRNRCGLEIRGVLMVWYFFWFYLVSLAFNGVKCYDMKNLENFQLSVNEMNSLKGGHHEPEHGRFCIARI